MDDKPKYLVTDETISAVMALNESPYNNSSAINKLLRSNPVVRADGVIEAAISILGSERRSDSAEKAMEWLKKKEHEVMVFKNADKCNDAPYVATRTTLRNARNDPLIELREHLVDDALAA